MTGADAKRWPPDQLETLDACPVCRSGHRSVVHKALADKLFHSSPDTWTLHACTACGTHYLDPRPDAASIGRAYTNYYTHATSSAPAEPTGPAPKRTGVRRTVHALANGYRNARWGTRFQPTSPLGRYLVPCIPVVRDALADQMRNLPPASEPHARLLDVGCGNGAFLQLAAAAGWRVEGTDFDAAAVETARASGMRVEHGGLDLLQRKDAASFDWITLSHVLEHVHDPLAWLHELHRILRPGGTLWLQTPNVASIGHRRFKDDWRGLEPPRHLTLWTLDTLTRQLRGAGFWQVQAVPTPTVRAMDVYANSEALARGMDHAQYLAAATTGRRRLRHLWLALLQHGSVRRSEFLTVLATR